MVARDRSLKLHRRPGYHCGRFEAMGSPCELLVDTDDGKLAEQVVNLAASEAWRIEDKFSRYLPENVVATINRSAGETVEVDSETANLLDFADRLYTLSDGRFDITSGVLRRVWTFDGGDRVPASNDVAGILALVGWDKAAWERPALALPEGMQIDLGGIGKEYAVDKAAAVVAGRCDCACLLNFGGDLIAIGEMQRPHGWQVGIESVNERGDVAERLIRLKTGALATSGDARRFLLNNGKRFGHILDPLTGWPVEDAPRSVTVAADTCTEAGMLATLAMLRGAGAEDFLESEGVRYWCIR